jgi:DNA-binding NarL/FixJ family response regulator
MSHPSRARGPRILVVTDDDTRAWRLCNAVKAHGEPVHVRGSRAASTVLRGDCVVAVVLDGAGCDGAIEVLEELRREQGDVPALVVISPRDAFTCRRAHDLDAVCLFEPWGSEGVREFLARALTGAAPRIARLLDSFGVAHTLAPREVELLRHVVDGTPPRVIAVRMGVSMHTIAAWRSRIRHKCGADAFAGVVRLLLLHALEHAEAQAGEGAPR